MASVRERVAATIVIALLAATSTLFVAAAQGDVVRVSSDLELLGIHTLDGGGHVTWTLTGEAARTLRARIVALFDDYARLPRGFAYAGNATGGNGNGVIENAEALSYTGFLENELEGVRYGVGADLRHVRIDRADLLERSLPVNRSTSGLVGSDASSTEALEIRFIFNAQTTSEDARFRFSDVSVANALFRVFDLRQVQSWVNVDPWPLVREGGWHPIILTDSARAFWHGNDTTWTTDPLTGRYDNDATNTSRTATEAGAVWLDLRAASSANASFRYLGWVANPGDSLRLQVAPGPGFSTWSDLPTTDGDVALPDSQGWRPVAYDLSPFLGQRVRLRLNFTSDAAMNDAPGFFIRDFRIDAPSTFDGTIESFGVDFLVGVLSLTDLDVRSGWAHVIRTPMGEVLVYSGAYDRASPTPDTARFVSFELLENPQLLFAALLVAAMINSRTRRRTLLRFRESHVNPLATVLTEPRAVKWAARGASVALVLLYFIPSTLAVVGLPSLFVTGPAFLVIAATLAVGVRVSAPALYRRAGKTPPSAIPEALPEPTESEMEMPAPPREVLAPPDPDPIDLEPLRINACASCRQGIDALSEVRKCACGQTYHRACAVNLDRCLNCDRPLGILEPEEGKLVTLRCNECGELQVMPETSDLDHVRCDTCGALLKGIDAGVSYLVLAPQPDVPWGWFQSFLRGDAQGLAVSPVHPERLRRLYGLAGVELHWLSEEEGHIPAIDPRRLEPDLLFVLNTFVRRAKGGAILIAGLERLISENGLEPVVRFLKRVTDLANVHEVTLFASVAPDAVAEEELAALRNTFERVLEPERSPQAR